MAVNSQCMVLITNNYRNNQQRTIINIEMNVIVGKVTSIRR